ncbi:MAG: hypothetical protein ABI388_03315 [Bacteroidia bacterium]
MKTDSNKSENKNQTNTQGAENAAAKKTTLATDKNKAENKPKTSSADTEVDDTKHQHEYTTPDAKSKSKDLKINGKGWDETPTDKKSNKK